MHTFSINRTKHQRGEGTLFCELHGLTPRCFAGVLRGCVRLWRPLVCRSDLTCVANASVPDTNTEMRHMQNGHLDLALFHLRYIISVIPSKVAGHLVLLDEERNGVFNSCEVGGLRRRFPQPCQDRPCCTLGPHPQSLPDHLQRPILPRQQIHLAARMPLFLCSRKARVTIEDGSVYDDQESASFFATSTRHSTSAAR